MLDNTSQRGGEPPRTGTGATRRSCRLCQDDPNKRQSHAMARTTPATAWLSLAALALLPNLTACGHVPPMSLYHLAFFDPMTADPMAIRAAVRLPTALKPKPGSAQMEIGYEGDGAAAMKERIVLTPMATSAGEAGLQGEQVAGTTIHVFGLDPEAARRVAELRRLIVERKADAKRRGAHEGKGSFSVSAGACTSAALPAGPLLMTTYLHWQPETGYIAVAKDVDLRSLVSPEKLAETVPDCAAE